jgi:hypothetical protein
MLKLIRDGGPPIWFIILFGVIALVDAVLIARRADPRKLAFLRAMTMTVVFAMITGFAGGVFKSIDGCAGLPPARRADWPFYLMKGTGESLADIVLGSLLLTLAWFIAAIGVRRRPPDEPAGV